MGDFVLLFGEVFFGEMLLQRSARKEKEQFKFEFGGNDLGCKHIISGPIRIETGGCCVLGKVLSFANPGLTGLRGG